MRQLVVGITNCGSFPNYERWFTAAGARVLKLTHDAAGLGLLAGCDGIVLSGGEDVHPRRYGKEEYLDLCSEIDERRDEMEFRVLEYTEKEKVPVLGICRGLQVANVFFGGTLIPDIPAFGRFNHSKFPDRDRTHAVEVDPSSALFALTGQLSGDVNSSHHQSADRVARGFVTNCLSPDGVVEGLERTDPKTAWMMLVQWHPERMNDLGSPFSAAIKEAFCRAAAARASGV